MPRPRVSLSGPQKRRAGELLALPCCCAVWMKRAACRRGCFTSFFPPLWPFGITLKVICTCRPDKEADFHGIFESVKSEWFLQENARLGAKVLWAHLIMQPYFEWPAVTPRNSWFPLCYLLYSVDCEQDPKARGGRWYFRSECWDRKRHHLHQEPQTFGENHVAIRDG